MTKHNLQRDVQQFARKFLRAAGMPDFERTAVDDIGVLLQRTAPAVSICFSVGIQEEEFVMRYRRSLADSVPQMLERRALYEVVRDAARGVGYDHELQGITLILSPRDSLTEANYLAAARDLAVLDRFMSMYLRQMPGRPQNTF